MSLDIIFYAIVAVVLMLRLWSVLGRRNEDDAERPNPFAPRPRDDDAAFANGEVPSSALSQLAKPITSAPASLAGGLEQVRALDPSFDEKKFLQGARQAFAMIIENFATDNLAAVHRLLGPDVLPHFQAAVAARQKAAQKLQTRVDRFEDVETVAARTEGSRAFVTVRFVSEQENVLRDAGGQVIGGAPGKLESVTDTWTFMRDCTSKDPNWILVETRG